MIFNLAYDFEVKTAEKRFKQLLERKVYIELKEKKKTRTTSQNAYLHVIFGLLGVELGYTVEEIKILCKRKYKSMFVYEKKGVKFLRSTATLDTKEMTEFIDWIRTYSSKTHGIYLPSPIEYYENNLDYDKIIEQNKEFLT